MNQGPATRWPIGACLLGLRPHTPDGVPAHRASPEFWAEELGQVHDAGFADVEVSDAWIAVGDIPPLRVGELSQVLADLGLKPCAVHVQRRSVIDPDHAEEHLAYHRRAMERTAELGVGIYSTGLHRELTPAQRDALWFWTVDGAKDPDDADTWKLAVSRVQELGRHAASLGLKLALELYEDTYLGTAQSAVRFVTDVGMAGVGINPDVGNLIRLHRPVESWEALYEATLPYAVYWHAKNYVRDEAADGSWFTSMPSTLRDGLIDYRRIVRRAVELGYDGPIICEHYGGDVLGVGAANKAYLEELLPRRNAQEEC